MLDGGLISQMIACPTLPGLKWNGFIYNSKGFETPEHQYEKPSNTKRVLLIGDSFAVGVVPYKKHFFRILEEKTNSELSPTSHITYEFINLGLGCIGPGIEKRVLELEGIKYAPDIIVYLFYVGNDFTDDIPREEKYTGYIQQFLSIFKLPAKLYQSRIISLITNLRIRYTLGRNLTVYKQPEKGAVLGTYVGGHQVQNYDPEWPTNTYEEYLKIVGRDLGIYDRTGYSNFPSVQQNILQMVKLTKSVSAKLLTVIVPAEIQVNAALQQHIEQSGAIWYESADYTLPQKTLTSFLKDSSIDFIDMLPVFQSTSSPELYYQKNDSHLSTRGESVVAETIYPWLQNALMSLPVSQ